VFIALEHDDRQRVIAEEVWAIKKCTSDYLKMWHIETMIIKDNGERMCARMNNGRDAGAAHMTTTTERSTNPEADIFDRANNGLIDGDKGAQFILDNCTTKYLLLDEWSYLNAMAFSFTVMTTVGACARAHTLRVQVTAN